MTSDVKVVENKVDNMKPGVYEVTYQVTNSVGESTSKTIQVQVLSRPIIEAKDHIMYVGDTYDPLKEVSASDLKDGDITSDVKVVENKVDNMKPGVYEVTYQITNSVGESTSKTIQVQVLSRPIIEAKDHIMYVGDTYDPLKEVSASDLKDGDITSDVKVVENKVDNMKPGVYEVTYQITNSVGESTSKTIQVQVLSRPIIEAKDHIMYVGDTYDPLKEVSASDLKDGDITSDVKVVENKVDNMKPGVYEVTYQVTNSVGESTSKTIQVQVLSRPIIEAKDHIMYVGD
ncbi:immunoglobulin-like domain-containing protein, partial [Listeria rocourtiae]|uniref:immunoglobulin-like domain-containing protein n=1 Tax=Listeria rocourtiae TaxID=647910 RepID=UPI00244B6AB2